MIRYYENVFVIKSLELKLILVYCQQELWNRNSVRARVSRVVAFAVIGQISALLRLSVNSRVQWF